MLGADRGFPRFSHDNLKSVALCYNATSFSMCQRFRCCLINVGSALVLKFSDNHRGHIAHSSPCEGGTALALKFVYG